MLLLSSTGVTISVVCKDSNHKNINNVLKVKNIEWIRQYSLIYFCFVLFCHEELGYTASISLTKPSHFQERRSEVWLLLVLI